MNEYLLKIAVKNAVKEVFAENGRYTKESGEDALKDYNNFTKLYSIEFERINKLTSTLQMTTKIIEKYKEMTGNKNSNIMDAVSFFAKKSASGNKVF
jgi:hypothetical protein